VTGGVAREEWSGMYEVVVNGSPRRMVQLPSIRARPEQRAIQILASKGADQPLHEWMGQGNVGDGLDFGHLQYPQIGLPLLNGIDLDLRSRTANRAPPTAQASCAEE
jgi:hypothetical protein